MPQIAHAERRTAGNALFQSYGMITCRAASEFQERANKSEWRGQVHVVAIIHDAIYCVIPEQATDWVNTNLIQCMKDHGLAELSWHPTVKITAELELYPEGWHLPLDVSKS
jgi:DNA polymerase-1